MKIIGLTGSIGMGKSQIAALLRQKRIPVFDSDAEVHSLLAPTGAAFRTIALLFPDAWDKKHHLIDRRKLGHIVFNDMAERRKLEAVLHPLVDKAQRRFILNARRNGRKTAALDIPLLFETGGERKCDVVFCASAPFFVQKLRVLRRAGMTESGFYKILAGQMPDGLKRRLADAILPTGLGRSHTQRILGKLLKKMGL